MRKKARGENKRERRNERHQADGPERQAVNYSGSVIGCLTPCCELPNVLSTCGSTQVCGEAKYPLPYRQSFFFFFFSSSFSFSSGGRITKSGGLTRTRGRQTHGSEQDADREKRKWLLDPIRDCWSACFGRSGECTRHCCFLVLHSDKHPVQGLLLHDSFYAASTKFVKLSISILLTMPLE